jgi:hypothetical protein
MNEFKHMAKYNRIIYFSMSASIFLFWVLKIKFNYLEQKKSIQASAQSKFRQQLEKQCSKSEDNYSMENLILIKSVSF